MNDRPMTIRVDDRVSSVEFPTDFTICSTEACVSVNELHRYMAAPHHDPLALTALLIGGFIGAIFGMWRNHGHL